jgi:hypothetical protein
MSSATKPTEKDKRKEKDAARLDSELEQSFPASDPPSSIQPGTKPGRPDRTEQERDAGKPTRSTSPRRG